MTVKQIEGSTLLRWQQGQFQHDQRNHTDIICLSRSDRLKHYGLHYAKYAGRVATKRDDLGLLRKTITDAALVFLSAANVLTQRLDCVSQPDQSGGFVFGALEDLADASGRFCDACEKIDHFEEFLEIARKSNLDVLRWILVLACELELDLEELIMERRKQLRERQFLIQADC